MLKFNEKYYRDVAVKTCSDLDVAVEVADKVLEIGFTNIFFVGVGGTSAMMTSSKEVLKRIYSKPVYLEHAAELNATGHSQLTKDSLIVTMSKSGTTQEVVKILEKLKKNGNTIVSFTSSDDCPIALNSTYTVPVVKDDLVEYYYMLIYAFIMRLVEKDNAISSEEFQQFITELKLLPDNFVRLKKEFDARAAKIAENYAKEPFILFVGGGMMAGELVNLSMCAIEEAQWIPTQSVSSSDLFHGTLEIIDENLPVILIKGQGPERVLDDRAENLLKQVAKKYEVIDPQEYALEGVADKFRWIYAPMITATLLMDRMFFHFEEVTGHDTQIRRYYKKGF